MVPQNEQKVHGACSLATSKGVYGTAWDSKHICITGDTFWPKVNVNEYLKRHTNASKETQLYLSY